LRAELCGNNRIYVIIYITVKAVRRMYR
jgi:hypothetical protein